ncbi:mechanosensitive ion channel family protein, partial [Planctomycetota bacterium]
GVGIGFGLQEILSNFVSGLIILVERPIEVGDIVTVDGLQGEIVQITIRATTVKTRDNVAIIVPNKEFITASVTNWSHGSPEVRIRVPVGVAYGSNVQLVRQVLRKVCDSYGRILRKPVPAVHFVGFGESSLDFEVAVWVGSPDPLVHNRVSTDLRCAIEAAFRRHNIEIPFAQLDLHVRGTQEGAGETGPGEGASEEKTETAQDPKSLRITGTLRRLDLGKSQPH